MTKSLKKVGAPFLILIVAFIIMMVFISMKEKPEKDEVVTKDFLVDARDIEFGSVEFFVYSQGNVQPKNQTMLSSQVSGQVVRVSDNFIEGAFFKQGDVLVELETADYETDLLLAEAELARVQAALDEEIARGRVAEQEWRSVNSGVAPQLGLRKPQLAREQANLKAAQAGLKRAKRNFERTKIRAPYDGLVKSRQIDVGQFLPMGSQIGEVFSTEVAEVRLPLTDDDMAFLNDLSNSSADVALKAEVAGQDIRWIGQLTRDEGILDGRSRVIYGVVEVNDPYLRNVNDDTRKGVPLRFGRFVSAEVSGVKADNIVTLPRNVLRLDGTVLTVDNDMKIKINDVNVLRADENFIYINQGLSAGEKVVVSAVPNPYEGMPVRFAQDNTLPNTSGEESTTSTIEVQ